MTTEVDPNQILRDFLDDRERRRKRVQTFVLSAAGVVFIVGLLGFICFAKHIGASGRLHGKELEIDLYWKEGGLFAGWGTSATYHPVQTNWYIRPSHEYPILTNDDLKQLKGLWGLESVEIKDCPSMTDDRAAVIAENPGLIELRLEAGNEADPRPTGFLTDASLKPIGTLKKLRSLSLAGQRITDNGIPNLLGLTELEDLDLDRTKVTGAGILQLAQLPKLKFVRLAKTKVSEASIQELQRSKPELTVIRLREE